MPLILLAFLLPLFARAQTPAPQETWEPASLHLEVQVDPANRLLAVEGTMSLRSTVPTANDVVLYLAPGGMGFDSVRADGSILINRNRDSVSIRPRTAVSVLEVRFFTHTRRDLGRSLIRPEGAMISWGAGWYPSLARGPGAPAVFEYEGTTRLTVPARWRTLSVGALVDSSINGPHRTDTWRADRPLPRSFIAGEYQVAWRTVGNARVGTFLLPRRSHRSTEFATAIPPMVATLERFFGAYPFGTFGIAELPRSVAPPGFVGRSEPGYFVAHTDALEQPGVDAALFVHELAHMWFPNAVDSRPPGDDMVDEAIASHAVSLYLRAIGEPERAQRELIDGHPVFSMRGYFHEVRRGADEPLMADYSPLIARAKGPLVYEMLRARIGDSAYFRVWRELVREGGSVSLRNLRERYQSAVPSDTGLATFFAQWLDRSGAPVVNATWAGSTVTLTQSAPYYQLPLPLRVRGTRRTLDTIVDFSAIRQTVRTSGLGTIRSVEVDPDHQLLVWTPEFGPPPNAPASWSMPRWERWMQAEATWLMRSYAVRSAAVALIDDGQVTWNARFGGNAFSDFTASARQLAETADTARTQLSWRGDTLVSITRGPSTGGGVIVVLSHGGWGGPQLAMHIAQRAAIQYRWNRIPR